MLGIALIVSGSSGGAYTVLSSCSNEPVAQAVFNLPSCNTLMFLSGVAFSALFIGVVVLVASLPWRPRAPR